MTNIKLPPVSAPGCYSHYFFKNKEIQAQNANLGITSHSMEWFEIKILKYVTFMSIILTCFSVNIIRYFAVPGLGL